MDIATVFGFVVGGLVLFITAMMGHGGLSLHNAMLFMDIEAAIVTYGGAMTAMCIAFPPATLATFMKVSVKAFQNSKDDMLSIFKTIVEFSTIARRDGILALEESVAKVDDPFLKKGIQMLVDGVSSDIIKHSIECDIEYTEKRHEAGHKMWEKLGYLGPALGMVGTLIGLVKMLATLNDPSKIGAGMAVALLTTFYGALLANFFAIPMECKLSRRTAEELLFKEMIFAGIMSIQSGDSPRVVAEKLKLFMKPSDREKLEAESGKSS